MSVVGGERRGKKRWLEKEKIKKMTGERMVMEESW